MRWGCILVHIHNEHRILPHKTQENKTGVTAAVTPASYPFEPVIGASKQLLYGVRPDGRLSHFRFAYDAAQAAVPCARYAVMFFLICLMAFFSRRETCACEMPISRATSVWVRPS